MILPDRLLLVVLAVFVLVKTLSDERRIFTLELRTKTLEKLYGTEFED